MSHSSNAPDPDVELVRSVLGALIHRGTGQWPMRAQAAVGALDRIVRSRRNAIATAHRIRNRREDDVLRSWETARLEPPD